MLSGSFFPNFGIGPFPKIAGKSPESGLQIYGGPGSLSHDFKIWPITSKAVGPVDPSFLVCEKNLTLIKNIHRTASLRTLQNIKYM